MPAIYWDLPARPRSKRTIRFAKLIALVPMDRILVETDSPYLTPEPMRKQETNEPAMVVHVAATVAQVKGVGIDEIDRITSRNAAAFYGWGNVARPEALPLNAASETACRTRRPRSGFSPTLRDRPWHATRGR